MIFDWQKTSESSDSESIKKLFVAMQNFASPMLASDYDFAVDMCERARVKYEDRVLTQLEKISGNNVDESKRIGTRLVVGTFCEAIWKTVGSMELLGELKSEIKTLQGIGEMAFTNAMEHAGMETSDIESLIQEIISEKDIAGITFMTSGARMVATTLIKTFETFDLLCNLGVDLSKIKEGPMMMAYKAWKDGASFSQLAGCFVGIAETPEKFQAILEDSGNVRKELQRQASSIIESLKKTGGEENRKGDEGCGPIPRWY